MDLITNIPGFGEGVPTFDTDSEDYFTRAEALGGSDTFDARQKQLYEHWDDGDFGNAAVTNKYSADGVTVTTDGGVTTITIPSGVTLGTNDYFVQWNGENGMPTDGSQLFRLRARIRRTSGSAEDIRLSFSNPTGGNWDQGSYGSGALSVAGGWVEMDRSNNIPDFAFTDRVILRMDAGTTTEESVFEIEYMEIIEQSTFGLTVSGSKALIDAMVVSMKAKGTWEKMREIYLHGIVSFGGLAAKLKYSTNPTLTLYNFVSGDYVQAGPLAGSTGDASAKYIDTNFIDSSLDPDDKSLGVYLMENAGVTTNRVVGVGDGTNSIAIQPNGTSLAAGIPESDARIFNIIPNATGFGVITRRGVNDVEAYGNGVSTGTDNATAAYFAMAYNYFLFARNNQGTAERWSDPRAGLFFIGEGLTTNDVQNLMDDFDALMDAIGAGVVYGPELFSDTTLDAPGDWNVSGDVAISGGEATFTAAANGSQISQAVLVDGVTYRIQYEIVSISNGGVQARAGFGIGAVNTAPGVYTEEITCITSTNAQFRSQLAPTDAVIDNVSVREVL